MGRRRCKRGDRVYNVERNRVISQANGQSEFF